MAGISAFDGRIRRRSPRPWPWFVAGLVLGLVIGWSGDRLLEGSDAEPTAEPEVAPRPTAIPLQTLKIIARPGRGMSLTADGPLTLESSGASKLTEQKEQAIFVGLRSWNGTVNYLTGGQGKLFLRDNQNVAVSGGWQAGDYRQFARGKPLQVKVKHDVTYTFYFQREGSTPINLGSFRVEQAP